MTSHHSTVAGKCVLTPTRSRSKIGNQSPRELARITLLHEPIFRASSVSRTEDVEGVAIFWGFNHASFGAAKSGISQFMGPGFSGYASVPAREPLAARGHFSGYESVYNVPSIKAPPKKMPHKRITYGAFFIADVSDVQLNQLSPNASSSKKLSVTAANSLGASIMTQWPTWGTTNPHEFSSNSRYP
ncbi:hypothetical protein PAN31117_03304 [Pandoraea anapnoica]|uniref:Uncharacterized protein n=1 Tax=Pandoraea anapnoica TaxID=2508301 RepID=A0A5E5ABB2_9BURK|nr:hypothetical protein PAN31117_03304 [Pandoraea anapnoica]